jgi:hypothetical protein
VDGTKVNWLNQKIISTAYIAINTVDIPSLSSTNDPISKGCKPAAKQIVFKSTDIQKITYT